ncbi:DHHC zinc finger domain-containing protein [Cryptosporidium andersoni]|uniref:Palmitoyltransferase n=1 Tax=Cryptosporidium andersoni TaxID=117008 RepID=A0A1J4MWE5_9CRYT|nr:DHHC zinc finger domain-containing protein [Cryptosporidium andersoni]
MHYTISKKNPLGLLPSRFLLNSTNSINWTGLAVCIGKILVYYPVWLLINYTSNKWYNENGPFVIGVTVVCSLINYTIYILTSFSDPGYLKTCPSTLLKPIDSLIDSYDDAISIELKSFDNQNLDINTANNKELNFTFTSSCDDIDLDLNHNNLIDSDLFIDYKEAELENLEKGIIDINDNNNNMTDKIFPNSLILYDNTSFNNNNKELISPIRLDRSTAALSIAMENTPGQLIQKIAMKSPININNMMNNYRFEGRKTPELEVDNTFQLSTEATSIQNDFDIPQSPYSSDEVDLLPRIKSHNINSTTFRSLNGFYIFKNGRMYQKGVRLRFCDYCRMYQPLRTKHCIDCERCIRTHDHHCPWIGHCIGEYNRCKFWWLCFFQLPECIWILYCIYMTLFTAKLTKINLTLSDVSILILVASLSIFMGALTTLLIVYHSFLAIYNLTTWENLAWSKISYLRSYPENSESPFSKGLLYNLAVYCIPYYVDDLQLGQDGEILWELCNKKILN